MYLNNYPVVPAFLNDQKIQVFTSQAHGDRGDIGKFFLVEQKSGYVLTIDDDLIYPEDYVSKMIKRIDLYNRKFFICVHANILPKSKLSSYYQDKQGIYFERKLEKDIRVDIPGTGTLGFHVDDIRFTHDIFTLPNMTDIWLAIYAKENRIPIIAIEREDNWLLQARGKEFEHSIYRLSCRNDSYQTNLINQAFDLA